MMIIIYSSQMVISAIAMEKQNKTLETLLTVPISRTSIITAKMLAAGHRRPDLGRHLHVRLQVVHGRMTGDMPAGAGPTSAAMHQLGLTFDTAAATSSSASPSSWPSSAPWPWP